MFPRFLRGKRLDTRKKNVPLVSVGRKCPGIQGVISVSFQGFSFPQIFCHILSFEILKKSKHFADSIHGYSRRHVFQTMFLGVWTLNMSN